MAAVAAVAAVKAVKAVKAVGLVEVAKAEKAWGPAPVKAAKPGVAVPAVPLAPSDFTQTAGRLTASTA